MKKSKIQHLMIAGGLLLALIITPQRAQAFYGVGDLIDQETNDRVVQYCANGGENTRFAELYTTGSGEPTRVLLLSFFASW